MAYIITDTCDKCGSCKTDCPIDVITIVDGKYKINNDECLECAECAALCHLGAIDWV